MRGRLLSCPTLRSALLYYCSSAPFDSIVFPILTVRFYRLQEVDRMRRVLNCSAVPVPGLAHLLKSQCKQLQCSGAIRLSRCLLSSLCLHGEFPVLAWTLYCDESPCQVEELRRTGPHSDFRTMIRPRSPRRKEGEALFAVCTHIIAISRRCVTPRK